MDTDWTINCVFASGQDTYRFRVVGYEGGDTLCPPVEYNPDDEWDLNLILEIDILDPNLLSLERIKKRIRRGRC